VLPLPVLPLPLVDPDEVPVPDVVSLVEPVVPLVEPVVPLAEPLVDPVPLVASALDPVDEPDVPIDEEPLDESSVPVTWTRLPTCFERSLLPPATRRYVVPDMPLALDPVEPEPLLLEGDVLLVDGEVLLPDDDDVSLPVLLLPVVPDEELLDMPDEPLPIMAFVSV